MDRGIVSGQEIVMFGVELLIFGYALDRLRGFVKKAPRWLP
jgi:hypothetical protein